MIVHVGDEYEKTLKFMTDNGYYFSSRNNREALRDMIEKYGRESCLDLSNKNNVCYCYRQWYHNKDIVELDDILNKNKMFILKLKNVFCVVRNCGDYYEPIGDFEWNTFEGADAELKTREKYED